MKLLFDTHAFLWWILADRRLSRTARTALDNPANSLHLSAAVGWEIATKHRIGKLPEAAGLPQRLGAILAQTEIQPLAISLEHAVAAGSFTADHRDPFDRMIAAQADIEKMGIVTNDKAFREFHVTTVW